MDKTLRELALALVDALAKCTCGKPALLADQGPDGDTYFTCDDCAPAVHEEWEAHRIAAERESGIKCEPLVTLTELAYAPALRALSEHLDGTQFEMCGDN